MDNIVTYHITRSRFLIKTTHFPEAKVAKTTFLANMTAEEIDMAVDDISRQMASLGAALQAIYDEMKSR